MHIDLGFITQVGGISLIVSVGSRIAEWVWKKNRESVQASLNSLDEKIEARTGYQWPIELHVIYDGLVKRIVSAIDYCANPVVFRRIERRLLDLADPIKRAALLTEFLAYVDGKAKETISSELKTIINNESETVAVEAVSAKASIILPPEFVKTRDLREDVKAAVVAVKQEAAKPTTMEITARIAATREKLDASLHK